MKAYIIRRLLGVPFLLLGITLVTFALLHFTPGSPIDQVRLTNPNMSAEDFKNIEATLGLNKPVHLQYLGWLGQLVRGDLGISMQDYRPVRDAIIQRVPNTLMLTVTSLVLSILIGLPLGVLSALKRNTRFDYITTVWASTVRALPSVWLGLLLIILFSVQFKEWGLPWLPTSGTRTLPDGGDLLDRLRHMILPVSTLALIEAAGFTKFFRFMMLEVLGQEYIRTARAKGLSERVVVMRHALRNVLLPWIALVGLTVPSLFGGAVIVESIFSWPGMGTYAVGAATNRDYTAVMGTVFFFSVLTVFSNLLADVISAVVDPRITLE